MTIHNYHSAVMAGAAGQGGAGYSVLNSVYADGLTGYFSRTPGVAGNQQKFTLSTWVKIHATTQSGYSLLAAGTALASQIDWIGIDGNQFSAYSYTAGYNWRVLSTAFLWDQSGWVHICYIFDTTQATASDRVKLYVNGAQITAFSAANYPAQNTNTKINSTVAHHVGQRGDSAVYLSSYLSEYHFVDGQALAPSSFGEFDATTGSWKPKDYTGTYGTNGFHLKFENGASLGEDSSGNGNNLAKTGTITQMTDSPTDQVANNIGNYATWNALRPSTSTLSNGNLTAAGTASTTFHVSQSDKWYWEITANAVGVTAGLENTSGTTYTQSVTNGTTTGFRYTHSTTTLEYTTDGTNYSTVSSAVSGTVFPYTTGASATLKNGSGSLSYTVPTGFKRLCTANMNATTGATSGSFTGNANADGPYYFTGAPPATLTIDGSAVTWGTHADKLATGFKIRTASSPYNDAATNNWTATYDTPQKPVVGSNHVQGKAQVN